MVASLVWAVLIVRFLRCLGDVISFLYLYCYLLKWAVYTVPTTKNSKTSQAKPQDPTISFQIKCRETKVDLLWHYKQRLISFHPVLLNIVTLTQSITKRH